jgi:uncharacterized protein
MTTTTQTAVELVKSLYEAFGRGDIAFIVNSINDDCRWVAPGATLATRGVYSGPQGVLQFFERMNATEEFTLFEPREYFSDSQGNVVVLGSEAMRSRKTGKEAKTEWSMVFRIRDGKVSGWHAYYDTEAYAIAHLG